MYSGLLRCGAFGLDDSDSEDDYRFRKKKYTIKSREHEISEIDGGSSLSYSQPYGYSRPSNITKKEDELDSSKISYTITVDMELYPGTELTPEQLNQSKCNSKYNAIRKAFSDFTGKPYVIPPVYPDSKNTTRKKLVQTKGGKRKTRKNLI